MNFESLLSNKWVLYGGGALAALAAYWYLTGSSAPADDGGYDAGGYLLPSSAIAPVLSGGSTSATGSGGLGIDASSQALIDLEAAKNATTDKLGVMSINANYATTMAGLDSANYLGGLFAHSTDLMTAAGIVESATKLLQGTGVQAASGSFNIPGLGDPLTFDVAQIYAATKKNKVNNSALGYLPLISSGNLGNAPSPYVSPGTPYQGAPTSGSAGHSSIATIASSNLGGAQSTRVSVLPLNTLAVVPAAPVVSGRRANLELGTNRLA